MATVTVPEPVRRPTAPPRNYWQLPMFAVGVAAAFAAVIQFPFPPTDPSVLVSRDLNALTAELVKRPANVDAVAELTLKLVEGADRSPTTTDEARFLAGTGYEFLADYGSPSDSAANWAAAVQQFTAVDPAKLEDQADLPRFEFRKAKALAAVGQGDPRTLFTQLDKPPFGEDEGGERHRLLAELCLKLDDPEFKKRAKTELTTYLGGPTRLPQPALAKLKFTLGQVHAVLNETEKARDWLNQIGSTATPDIQAAAKVELGRLAAAEGNWSEQVLFNEAALATPELPAADRAVVLYQTGIGMTRLKNLASARQCFEQAAKDTGPVATAAAVRLAEIVLRDPDARGRCPAAVELLESAVSRVEPGNGFVNPFVAAAEAQAVFEVVVQVCLNEPDFPSAVRAVSAYAKVSPPGRDRERRAEVYIAWAVVLQKDAATVAEAAAKLRSASTEYVALAEAYPTLAGKADLLRKAADCLKKAGDRAAAIATLDRIDPNAGVPPEAAAAVWLDKGELLLQEGKSVDAEVALSRAIDSVGPIGTVARVKLALVHLDRGRSQLRAGGPDASKGREQLELGQALLSQVAGKTTDSAGEREAQQQALYELGILLIDQNNISDAEARFRQLIQIDPTGSRTGLAQLYLGSCLLKISQNNIQNGRTSADGQRKLLEARELFTALTANKDPFLRTQAEVRLVNTLLLLGRYDEMSALCNKLVDKLHGRVEELIVLSMLYVSQWNEDRKSDAARTLSQMEDVYGKLRDSDYRSYPEQYTREYWKNWFDVCKPAGGVR